MKRWMQVTAITAGCVLVYVGMRSLPVEPCSFLHYGDYINEDGVIEGCGYEETAFFDLAEIRFPILTQLRPLEEPEAGKPVPMELVLTTTTGNPVRWEEIAVSHTERIHAMVVDPSLEDYQHLHPQPTGAPGHYSFTIHPKKAGTYAVYLDLIPLTNSRRTLLSDSLAVPGEPPAAALRESLVYRHGDLALRFRPHEERLPAGKDVTFSLEVTNTEGGKTAFSPVMDSYAHVVAFDPDREGFAHLHPQNPFLEGQDPMNPELDFVFRFDEPGLYRVWAQMIVNGEQIFAPFDLRVEAS